MMRISAFCFKICPSTRRRSRLKYKGRIFTHQQIFQNIWKEPYYQDDGNIMSIISKLRKKIEPDPEHPFYVLTVYGVGYRFNEKA